MIIEEKVLDPVRAYRTTTSSSTVRSSVCTCLSPAYFKLMVEPSASATSVLLRQKILKKCRDDIYHFLNHENGQIAIYDAVNPLAAGRRSLAKEFAKHDVEVL